MRKKKEEKDKRLIRSASHRRLIRQASPKRVNRYTASGLSATQPAAYPRHSQRLIRYTPADHPLLNQRIYAALENPVCTLSTFIPELGFAQRGPYSFCARTRWSEQCSPSQFRGESVSPTLPKIYVRRCLLGKLRVSFRVSRSFGVHLESFGVPSTLRKNCFGLPYWKN